MIISQVSFVMKEMSDVHPQGMKQRNYDGKTGGGSIGFSRLCLIVFVIIILIVGIWIVFGNH